MFEYMLLSIMSEIGQKFNQEDTEFIQKYIKTPQKIENIRNLEERLQLLDINTIENEQKYIR